MLYNDKTLNVYRSEDGTTWGENTPDATCDVVDGICTFTTDHLSYFTMAEIESRSTDICLGVTSVPQAECEALVSIYYNTAGDNWKNSTNR